MSTPDLTVTSAPQAIAAARVGASGLRRPRQSDLLLRAFDLGMCFLLLPVALAVGALTAVLIFVDSPGSVFYRSTRVGRGGRTFAMLKFRKMRRAAEGLPLTLADDERFTPIGRFLAMTKLDELPQLWNVIKGDMRLVGPRPEVEEFVARYREHYDEILAVVPGITGPAAVEYAGESHLLAQQASPLSYYLEQVMPRKIAIDTEYVRTRSLLGDVRIVARTVIVPMARIAGRARRVPMAKRVEIVLVLGVGSVLALAFLLAGAPGS